MEINDFLKIKPDVSYNTLIFALYLGRFILSMHLLMVLSIEEYFNFKIHLV